MKFRDLFNRIETIKTNNSEDKIKKINCLKEDIRSCTQSIQTQLTHETLSNQFNELNKIRNKLKESTKKNSARARQCLYAQIELECKRESQKEETEKIKQKFDEIENERSNIFENDGENDLSKIETISGYVNDLKYYLSSSETTTKNYDISKQYQSLREIRNDLDSIRQMTDQNNQILLSTASQAKWSSSFQPISLPNEYSYHPIERPNTGPFYLEEMRRKLRDVQDIRMSNLENTSKFLTSLRRKEAKRAHDQKTKIAYSDGSYFSPYE
ncbi:hypothetical protein GPJ56_010744 [Histomonas meleagridis]|uniref:uncharacterized protein n=1 Tax=Histomonas meleagridis TaxID=135588 RepID=UPI003559DCD2|nr:hypothetical protein GPJ56_010744 [Histomonas meleagridis]KAH0801080.1 hypothetical protein GO595_006115 [Histomonas meleagridis]